MPNLLDLRLPDGINTEVLYPNLNVSFFSYGEGHQKIDIFPDGYEEIPLADKERRKIRIIRKL